ncbi:D-Ala-D-Ala carboxypeptidase DacF. Serine peptidase. MEROPS family S11 [Pelagirhabdus alkalitolerans]|uniref:serine-type D-Ala-D-Ala carboxypeptidase n=1 Tax=Pelagirhabdus alkalitolerans TaxID=1612202 RepID=A0A1G6HBX4_9BACI|nr:D-alanyl-D-alanine carboxypeptidase family protein [Pelagirhabdus alkalitolerans]SDB91760.1 D-Ala-D-Ala carboxypeptidase DacF. Serine peptidase. MEROPS family S11 [Pelagirhabdus alkalitolerans]
MRYLTMLICCLIFLVSWPQNLSASIDRPSLSHDTRSVVLMEYESGRILYADNEEASYSPASMTKMMTLLLIAEAIETNQLSLTDQVTVTDHAASMGGTQIFLEENEQMTVQDLLKAIAIASANDATVALAEHIFGNETNAVEAMNEKAKDLELTDTQFQNTTGLPADDHYASAQDIAKIANELLNYEWITDYTSIYEDYLREDTDDAFWLVNTNKLVKHDSTIDGLKTGYTADAKYCLTASAIREDMRLIAVVMGADSVKERNKTIQELFDYGYAKFDRHVLVKKDEVLTTADVFQSEKSHYELVGERDLAIILPKNEALENVQYNIYIDDHLKAPINQEQVVGTVEVLIDKEVYASVNLRSTIPIKKANWTESLFDVVRRFNSL